MKISPVVLLHNKEPSRLARKALLKLVLVLAHMCPCYFIREGSLMVLPSTTNVPWP